MKKYPFSKDELTIIDRYYVAGRTDGGKAKFKTPISSLENMRAFLNNETPCWMPNGDLITITPEIIPDNVARAFVQEADPTDRKGGPDMFGVQWVYEDSAGGSMVIPGNPILDDANDWKEVIHFPDVDSWDWAGSAEKNRDYLCRDLVTQYWFFTGFFERLISFMDFEEAAVALIDEDQTDAIHEFFGELADFYDALLERLKRWYDIDCICFHDDAGTQRDSFFSLKTYREMIVPYIRRVVDSCHKRGILVELHSCGKNDRLIEGIVETGVDLWTPQNICDIDDFYDRYGDKIMFGINSDLKDLGPLTPEEDVVAAAKRFVKKYGPHMEEKPVLSASWGAPVLYTDVIYEESRKLLGQ